MSVPEGAKKTLQEAEEAMKELEKLQNTPADGALPEPEPAKEEPTQEPEPEPEKAPEPEPEEEIPAAVKAKLDEINKRLQSSEAARKVLEGKYNAEVRDVIRENNSLKELLKQKEEPPKAPVKELTFEEELLKDEDVKYVHDEHPEIFKTVMKGLETMKKNFRVPEADTSSKQDLEFVKAAVAKQETSAFWKVLNESVPDWQQIRDMPEFTLFLSEPEDFSGRQFNEIAMDAVNSSTYDGEKSGAKMAKIYNAFKTRHGISSTPQSEPQPPSAPQKQISLPNRGRPSIPKGDDGILTESQITEHYRRIQAGYYKDKPDEFKKMDAAIGKALKKSVGALA